MKRYLLPTVVMVFLLPFLIFAQQLEIHHLNVGQADATLIKSPTGVTMLIDAGNDGNGTSIVLPYLTSLGITSLNYIVCSHYHADHLGGLDEVINSLGSANIGAIYDRGSDSPLPTTVAFNNYVSAANATGKRYKVALGQTLDLGGGISMQCLATDGEVYNYGIVPNATSTENDLSIGWKMNYSSFQYFTGGDLGGETSSYADSETPLAPQVGDVDAFKINHHGSQYSTNQVFVNTLQSEVGIISVGTNSYGHPTQTIIDRLVAANCYIYQTATGSGGTIPAGEGVIANNHVILKTSGTSYTVSYGTTTNTYPGDGGSSDVTPPVISNVAVSSITTTGAVVTWTTDEASTSVVEYGLTTSYGSTTSNSTLVTSHSITLSGLTAGTTYHYRVKSADGSGNLATGTDHSFQTGNSYTYAPTSTTISVGTLKSGTYANLATNNASYYVVNSTTTATMTSDWYGSVTISQAPSSVTSLTVTYDGKNSRSLTQKLYLFNYSTSAWNLIDTRTVSTSDVTITYSPTTPGNFISTTGIIRLRVYGSLSKTFYASGDYMAFTVTTVGTSLTKPMVEETIPLSFGLSQNYPNPFNPVTRIQYQIPEANTVTLKVYDIVGREVATLVNGIVDAGTHEAEWNAFGFPSGVYFYRLQSGNLIQTQKMMLLK